MSSLDFVADVIAGLRAEGGGGGSVCGLPDVFGKGWTKTSRRMGQDEQEEGSIHYVKYFNFCFRPY